MPCCDSRWRCWATSEGSRPSFCEISPADACPARSVGLALLLGAFGGGLLVTGSVAFAGLVFAGAAAVAYAGAGLSLSRLRPPAAAEEGELALRAAVAADETLRLMVEARTLLRGDLKYADMAAEARIAADRNLEEGWEARPETAHQIPPPLEKFSCEPRRLRGVGEVAVLRFTSEFEPQDPEVRDAYLAVAPNRTAQAVLLRHGGTPRPTLIYCHGYGCGQPWLDARLSGAQRLHAELGLDVALFSLPLHGARAAGWQSALAATLAAQLIDAGLPVMNALADGLCVAAHVARWCAPRLGAGRD